MYCTLPPTSLEDMAGVSYKKNEVGYLEYLIWILTKKKRKKET